MNYEKLGESILDAMEQTAEEIYLSVIHLQGYREQRNFEKADQIRDRLKEKHGIVVNFSKDGTVTVKQEKPYLSAVSNFTMVFHNEITGE